MTDAPLATRRIQPREIISPEALAEARRRIPFAGIGMIAHAWAIIALAIAMVDWTPHWALWIVTVPLAIAVIGSRQLGLAILVHEAAHGCLAKDPRVNMGLAQWLCAYPVFTDTPSYRDYHLFHHAHAQTKKDPDLVLSAPFPVTRESLKRKLFRDLTGQTGFKQRKAQILNGLGKPGAPFSERFATFRKRLARPLLMNAMIFAVMIAAGVWWAYPLLWLLPLLTWQQAVTRIRNIAEHALIPVDGDPLGVARTTQAGPIARLFLAPYYVNYHAEHHFMMYVPCYNLPGLHRALKASADKARFVFSDGYGETLAAATAKAA